MRFLFAHLEIEQAYTYSLVLTASGIAHQVHSHGQRWRISVPFAQCRSAQQAIGLYLKENQTTLRQNGELAFRWTKTYSAIFVAMILIVVHLAVQPGYERQVFIGSFGASAERILQGELFRCITALLLHADWPHVLANAAGIMVFGTAVAANYGWGVGWLLILLAAVQGNFLTALWYHNHHLSVGASTAVFAAVGLCAVLSAKLYAMHTSRSWRAWTPLAAGLALLGWLGTAPQSDLVAHLLGFGSGLFFGGLFIAFVRRRMPWPFQLAAAIMASILIAGACVWGLYASG